MPDHSIPWVRLVGVALLAGCGATSSGETVPHLVPEPASSRSACNVYGTPGSIHDLVDSTRAVTELAQDNAPDGGVVLSFARDSTGELTRFRLVQATVDSDTAEQLRQLLESLARERTGDAAGPRSGRLLARREGGNVASLRVGLSRACRPTTVNEPEVSRLLDRVHRETGLAGSALVRVYVDTTGTPEEVLIHQGSGNVELDRRLQGVARQLRFDPADIDGHRVPVWVELPLHVRRAQPRRDEP